MEKIETLSDQTRLMGQEEDG